MTLIHGKWCSVAQPQNYNKQSLTMYSKLYINSSFVYTLHLYFHSTKYNVRYKYYIHMFRVFNSEKSSEGIKNCGTGSDNTTLSILFTVVSTQYTYNKYHLQQLLYIMHLN